MRYLRLVAPSLAGIAAAALICLPAHAADKVKVSYPTLTSSYIFFFSAIQKGYYKDEGLDLDVIEAAGGVATPALVSGDVQFSTSGSSARCPIAARVRRCGAACSRRAARSA